MPAMPTATSCTLLLLASVAPAMGEIYHVAQRDPNAGDENRGSADEPWRTISQAAATLQPGDTVVIHAGVYREQVKPARSGEANRPITYRAAKGEHVVITGADVVQGWVRVRDGVWKKEPWPYRFPTHPNNLRHRLVGRCEQVILDGELLRQVERADEMRAGDFCADTAAGALYISPPDGADPNQRLVEASVRPVSFGHGWGGPERHHIRLRGVAVRYASNTAQRGAVFIRGDGCRVEDCVVEWTNGTGLSFRGDNVVLARIHCLHNGQQGLSGGGNGFLLADVVLEDNNIKGFDTHWEAGGFKITHARDGVVRRCQALRNNGTGMWFDIDVRDVLVQQCFAKDNAGHGIYVEISGGFQIRDNLCVHNGTDNHWGRGGISVAESDHCTIEHNTCVLNPTGISIREQGPRTFRGIDGGDVTYFVHDISIRRNISALNSRYQVGLWWDNVFFGPHPDRGRRGTPFDPDKQRIVIDENLYWMTGDQQLALWGCPWREGHKQYADLGAWQKRRGQDRRSLAADPLFIAPSNDDWNVRPASRAREIGAGPRR